VVSGLWTVDWRASCDGPLATLTGVPGRLSPQTLIVASLASLTAAIVTSHFWRGGTPITAAITPVLVALASEIYRRPAERITKLSSRAAATTRVRGSALSARDEITSGPPAAAPDEGGPDGVPEDGPLLDLSDAGPGPVRVYRPESNRRFHLKIVLATAVVAFAIALAVLTLPELIFGGSLASHARTTFFGGNSHHHRSTTKTTTTATKAQSSSAASTPTTATKTVTTTTQPQQTVTQTTRSTPAPPVGASGPAPAQ
jgi:hypothetical protein